MIHLDRAGEVFILTMDGGENRWNTTFTRAFAAALDEVEAAEGPAALVTLSSHEKFFSNGVDLEWFSGTEDNPPGGDRTVFGEEFPQLLGRISALSIPTVAVINGHAFGAGLLCALCHDVRFMRADRGFACANEIKLGLGIPAPVLALFRHKLPEKTFSETFQLARRWTGPDALSAGLVQQIADLDTLRQAALSWAADLAREGAKRESCQSMP